jgi:hypothetical protein
MSQKPTSSIVVISAWILGILTAATLIMQLFTANSTTSKLETTLFSVLQFVFSIGFAILLTRATTKNEFQESQRKFAMAAFRRINEIDEGVERILNRATKQIQSASTETCHELEVVHSIAVGIRSSIKSSISDWGDIIGEEISKFEQIEKLETEQNMLLASPKNSDDSHDNSDPLLTTDLLQQIKENDEKLSALVASLPYPLQIISKKERPRDEVVKYLSNLEKEIESTGALAVNGFWDPSFEKDIREFKVGDLLHVRTGDTGDRSGILVAYDKHGKSVAVITNKIHSRYYIFREAIFRVLERSEFDVEITSISADDDKKSDRHYFTAKICVPKRLQT